MIYLGAYGSIETNQQGLKSGQEILTHLLEQQNYIFGKNSIDNNMDRIYLYFSKVFGILDKTLMPKKMAKKGINRKFLQWIRKFLPEQL